MNTVHSTPMGTPAPPPSGGSAQYLTFTLGTQVFAMDIFNVREIVQQADLTTVPLMPGFVRGVINLRGAVVPVIDLQVRFGRPQSVYSKKTCIVIFDSNQSGHRSELGLLVDAVNEVVEIASANVEPPPQFGTTIRRDFIHGMGKIDGAFIVILDPASALDTDDMADLVAMAHDPAQAGHAA